MNTFYRLLIITALCAVTACATTGVREHPQLESRLEKIDNVVILPPRAVVELIVFSGENERLEVQEAEVKVKLKETARASLANKGYGIVDFDFSEEAIASGNLPFAINQTYKGFSTAKSLLYEKPRLAEKDKRSIRADVGTAINTINEETDADAVLLMNYSGFEKSAGMITKDIAAAALLGILTMGHVAPIKEPSGSSMEAALIDSVTGEVLWSNYGAGLYPESVLASLPADVDPAVPFQTEEPVSDNSEDSEKAGSL